MNKKKIGLAIVGLLLIIGFGIFYSIKNQEDDIPNTRRVTIDGGCCSYKNYDIVLVEKRLPKVGEVVAFNNDRDFSLDHYYYSRCGAMGRIDALIAGVILALPGDKIYFSENEVKVNGIALPADDFLYFKSFTRGENSHKFFELNGVKYSYEDVLNKEIIMKNGYYLIENGAEGDAQYYCDQKVKTDMDTLYNGRIQRSTATESEILGVILKKVGFDKETEKIEMDRNYD